MKRIDEELKKVLTVANETALKLLEMNSIDFDKLPVDTLLICFDSVDRMQRGVGDKLYFASFFDEKVFCYPAGRSSKTAGDYKPICVSYCLISK